MDGKVRFPLQVLCLAYMFYNLLSVAKVTVQTGYLLKDLFLTKPKRIELLRQYDL